MKRTVPTQGVNPSAPKDPSTLIRRFPGEPDFRAELGTWWDHYEQAKTFGIAGIRTLLNKYEINSTRQLTPHIKTAVERADQYGWKTVLRSKYWDSLDTKQLSAAIEGQPLVLSKAALAAAVVDEAILATGKAPPGFSIYSNIHLVGLVYYLDGFYGRASSLDPVQVTAFANDLMNNHGQLKGRNLLHCLDSERGVTWPIASAALTSFAPNGQLNGTLISIKPLRRGRIRNGKPMSGNHMTGSGHVVLEGS